MGNTRRWLTRSLYHKGSEMCIRDRTDAIQFIPAETIDTVLEHALVPVVHKSKKQPERANVQHNTELPGPSVQGSTYLSQ